MQLSYRGVEYTQNNSAQVVDTTLSYRGAKYTPAEQAAPPAAAANLTYRGVEYRRPQGNFLGLVKARQQKKAALALAKLAFTRNLSTTGIV